MLLQRCLNLFGFASQRENEFDTGKPGKPRAMRGILERLTEEQKRAALSYVEPEAVKQSKSRAAA
jgi:hypothetical protein